MDIMTIISNAAGELIAPTTAAYVLAAIGLNIHFGMTGLMNMGQAGFMLLGAYGFAITQSMGCNLFASVCAALALAVIYALLLGIPTLKLGPDYLAMVTLAAAEIIRIIGRSTAMTNFTGGSAGISPQDFTEKFESLSPLPDGSTTFLLWTYSNNIANSWWLRIVAWVLVVIAALLCWRWFHSPWGRMLKGIREDENAIRSLGKPVTRYKMESLILGGLFGAIAGIIFVLPRSVQPDSLGRTVTFYVWTILLLGGAATILGPVLHKISRKKKKQFKSNLKKWVKENRNTQFDEFMKALNKKLTGSFNYYSLSGMIKEVRNLWQHSLYVTFKWLNRRSQRRSFKLERFYDIWNDRIIHPYIHVDIWSGDKVIYNKNV